VHAGYAAKLATMTVFDDDTRAAYASRVRQYLAWLAHTDVDGDPLTEKAARDGAVRDYRTHLQTVLKRAPATINTILAALADFYTGCGEFWTGIRRQHVFVQATALSRWARGPVARHA
jgi:hypothetical protein